jgi:uncharacterized protein YqfA (UPF0365 family)
MKEGGRYDMCKGLRDWEAEIVEAKDKEKKAALEAKDKESKAALKEKDAKILELEEEIRRLKAEKKEA